MELSRLEFPSLVGGEHYDGHSHTDNFITQLNIDGILYDLCDDRLAQDLNDAVNDFNAYLGDVINKSNQNFESIASYIDGITYTLDNLEIDPESAEKIQRIIDELEGNGATASEQWATLVDKLHDVNGTVGEHVASYFASYIPEAINHAKYQQREYSLSPSMGSTDIVTSITVNDHTLNVNRTQLTYLESVNLDYTSVDYYAEYKG